MRTADNHRPKYNITLNQSLILSIIQTLKVTEKEESIVRKRSNSTSIFLSSILIALVLECTSCKKFVEVDPPNNQLVSENVFSSDATAISALTGIYTSMASSGGFASGGGESITILSGLSADEYLNFSAAKSDFENNSLSASNSYITTSLWSEAYQYIYTANAIIEGAEKSTELGTSVRQQIIGEAKFIRAFCYFYLTNLFGDIPLHLSTNYQINMTAPRTTKQQVYKQIILDTNDAKNALASDYSSLNNERIRPIKWAASALLSRVYLYMAEWALAENESSAIINNISLYDINIPLSDVFFKNSMETIWQLPPSQPNINTKEGELFILTAPPTEVTLSDYVLKDIDALDIRKSEWINDTTFDGITYYYPFKYKIKSSNDIVTEYSMVLRLAEQYLIRSEARIELNNMSGSLSDLNVLRRRAGLSDIVASNKKQILLAVEHERQAEFFSEWGHRWLDLKRMKGLSNESITRADEVLAPIKGANWQSSDILYPIPQMEIINNQNIKQNAGY